MVVDTLRDRTRRAVQAELIGIAQKLVIEQGYENVTVEQISAAAGLSRRSFFRYFPSKEALIIGKYELFGEQLVAALASRPEDENIWESLRRMFDPMGTYLAEPGNRRDADALQRVILASPALHGGFLRAQDPIQSAATKLLLNRARTPNSEVRMAAVVGAAFACYQTAIAASAADPSVTFDHALDDAWGGFAVHFTDSH